MIKALWGSVATLFVALLVLVVISLRNVGDPPMILLNPSPLVDEGVAMVMVCGKQPTRATVNMTAEAVIRPGWIAGQRWTRHERDRCVLYYQHPRNVD